jgi:hypothetical protein
MRFLTAFFECKRRVRCGKRKRQQWVEPHPESIAGKPCISSKRDKEIKSKTERYSTRRLSEKGSIINFAMTRQREPDSTGPHHLVLATRLALLKATVQSLSGTRALMGTFNIARILNDHIIIHDNVGLAVSVVRILIVVVVVVIAH